jgi:hypothetical protein
MKNDEHIKNKERMFDIHPRSRLNDRIPGLKSSPLDGMIEVKF